MPDNQSEYDEAMAHAVREQHDKFFELPIDGLTEEERRARSIPESGDTEG